MTSFGIIEHVKTLLYVNTTSKKIIFTYTTLQKFQNFYKNIHDNNIKSSNDNDKNVSKNTIHKNTKHDSGSSGFSPGLEVPRISSQDFPSQMLRK